MELKTIDLRAAAVEEAARVAAARAIRRGGDEAAREWLSGRRPWIARARAGRRRAALSGRLVSIWQIAAEDSSGSVAAAAIVAVKVEIAARADGRSRKTIANDLVSCIQRRPPKPLEDLLREETDRIVTAARAFANARLIRARAVAACASRHADAGRFQPGLFDRRAERARRHALAAGAEEESAVNARVAAAAAAADVTSARPALLLVLTA